MARAKLFGQAFSRTRDRFQQPPARLRVVAAVPDGVQEVAGRFVQEPARQAQRRAEIRGRVDGAQHAEEVAEVVQQGIAQMGNEVGVTANRAFVALQALAAHAARLERLIEGRLIAVSAQKLKVGLADHDVVRGGVVVQLLVPLFEKMSRHLLDVVPVHDLKNAVTHPLPLAAPAKGTGDHP